MSELTVEKLVLAYGKRVVLQDIDFSVVPGEMLGLIGPNGSGKSTLIKAMSRVICPRTGRILLGGKDIATMSRNELAKCLAVVPQWPILPLTFSALEVVMMGRTPHLGRLRFEGEKDMVIVWEAMGMTGTQPLSKRPMGELSGGERQRVIIARALAQEAKFLLLDEPTSSLDIKYQIETLDLFKKLCLKQGLGIVAALHDLNIAAQYCDRLVMLNHGNIHSQGSLEEVITAEAIKEVYGADVHVYPHPVNQLPTTCIVPGFRRES